MSDLPDGAVVDASILLAALNPDEAGNAKSLELVEDAFQAKIQLWAPMVALVEVLRWTRDALYIATAVIVEVDTVYTWDSDLLDLEYEQVTCCEPPGSSSPRLPLGE